jgi:molybdate transport system regulatory protein
MGNNPVLHLTQAQLDELTRVFREWYDSAPTLFARRVRGRYWITFLCLRYTGARIGEVLSIDDSADIDFSGDRVTIRVDTQGRPERNVPVPSHLLAALVEYLEEFPSMRGKIFTLDQGNFRREFYRRAEDADIPRKLAHPHILRHTRAMEMVRAGVPLSLVSSILGHAGSTTVLIYLESSTGDPESILRQMGLL